MPDQHPIDRVNCVLKKFEMEASGYFSNHEIVNITTINCWERRYSTIIEVQINFQSESRTAFIKIARLKGGDSPSLPNNQEIENVQKEYSYLEFFYDKSQDFPNWSVTKPITCYPDDLTIVTEFTEGTRFADMLWQQAKFFPSQKTVESLKTRCLAVGNCLRAMQDLTRHQDETYDVNRLIEDVKVRLTILNEQSFIPFGMMHQEKILNFYYSQKPFITQDDCQVAGVHSDFAPGNLLLHNDQVILLDFATFSKGSIYLDPAKLFYQFSFLTEHHIFRPTVIIELQKAFLKGYQPTLNSANSLFRLFVIRHALCDLLNSIKKKKNYPMYKLTLYKWFWKKRLGEIMKMCSN